MSKCSHGREHHACVSAFDEWVTGAFDIEETLLWRTRRKSKFTVTHTRIWPTRPDFNAGDWVVGGASIGGIREIYEILQRTGTPKRPHYDVRIVASCCPGNIYEGPRAKRYHIDKIGTIVRTRAGNSLLKATPKQEPLDLFHCDETHTSEPDWPTYQAPKKKRRKK
jgi:hypothetical protein